MTLILTEVFPYGVAMAADSAVTYTDKHTGAAYAMPNNATKLQAIPVLGGGVSCWGLGEIDGVQTDEWLSQFIIRNENLGDLREFADKLASDLDTSIAPSDGTTGRLGFHVAGLEDYGGTRVPTCYHVHDGPSSSLASRGETVDPRHFNANHDFPPKIVLENWQTGHGCILRNGDYQLYAELFRRIEGLFKELAQGMGIFVPAGPDVRDRASYLVFQIRTVSEIYRLSNLVPGIGGGIDFLTIDLSGIRCVGTEY